MKAKLEVEMPEGCYDCQFCAGIECGVVEGMPTIDLFGEEGLRPKWCPLIPEEIMDNKLLTDWIPVSDRLPAGEKTSLLAANIAETRKFNIETPDVVIKVNPERMDLVEARVIDGRQCLVIAVDDHIEVNGINVRTMKAGI